VYFDDGENMLVKGSTPEPMQEEMLHSFNRRTFAVTAILTVILIFLVPGVIYLFEVWSFEHESVRLLKDFIAGNINEKTFHEVGKPRQYAIFHKKVSAFLETASLIELKLWDQSGTCVYSFRDPDTVGERYVTNPGLRSALRKGDIDMALEVTHEQEDRSLQKYGAHLEVYVPVTRGGRVIGAVEVYRLPPPYRLWGPHMIGVAIVASIMLVLLYVVFRGSFKKAVNRIITYDRKLSVAYHAMGRTYFDTIKSLAKALEYRDMETEGHSERVVALSMHLGRCLQLNHKMTVQLLLGSYLHDIGKIGIADAILLKKGRLDMAEEKVMKQHVFIGYDLIKDIEFLKEASNVILYHHERWDGSGYPSGLQAEDIPLTARIFAVADVADALLHKRPYKEEKPFEEVKETIKNESGKHFDPTVVEWFNSISYENYLEIIAQWQDGAINKIIMQYLDEAILAKSIRT